MEYDDPLYDEVMDYILDLDCSNTRVTSYSINNSVHFQVIHLMEGQIIRDFIQDATAGYLASGATAQTSRVAVLFFRQANNMALLNPPHISEAPDDTGPWVRVIHTLGSRWNRSNFVLLEQELNRVKGTLSLPQESKDPNSPEKSKQPVAQSKIIQYTSSETQVQIVLSAMRASIASIRYLNFNSIPSVNQRLANVVNLMGDQIQYAQTLYNSQNLNNRVNVLEFWREWIKDFYGVTYLDRVKSYIEFCKEEVNKTWENGSGSLAAAVRSAMASILDDLNNLSINTSKFD